MNIHYYAFYYPVIKNRNGKEVVIEKYEDIDNDYINFDDFVIPNHKLRETKMKSRNL